MESLVCHMYAIYWMRLQQTGAGTVSDQQGATPMSTAPLSPRAILTVSNEGGETMSMAVETLPINQAALALAFPEALLRHLVVAGVIAGDKSTCDLDQAAQVVAQLRAAQKPVEGNPILATEASVKYGFPPETIYRWQEAGRITLLEFRNRGRLFDEGDIALARALADLVGQIAGRSVFPAKPRSGRPRKTAA